MSHLLSRLLLAIFCLLALPIVYVSLFAVIERTVIRNDDKALIVSSIPTAMMLVSSWIFIWYRQIQWTPKRWTLTWSAIAWSLVPAIFLGVLVGSLTREEEIGVVIGTAFWAVTWLGSTAVIWRETALERAHRLGRLSDTVIACPRCGYNMTGLQDARCPECGTQYTLDELIAPRLEKHQDIEEAPKRQAAVGREQSAKQSI